MPPGNMPGESSWTAKRVRAPKPEIRLTPGKGLADLTCSVEGLIDQVVKGNKVRDNLVIPMALPICRQTS